MTLIRRAPEPAGRSAPFWQAVAERRLVLQVCDDCGVVIGLPRRACPSCEGDNLGWRAASGSGEVEAYVVQETGPLPGCSGDVLMPFVMATIVLDEGVQIPANLVGAGAADVGCGDRVTVDFADDLHGFTLPVFRLAG